MNKVLLNSIAASLALHASAVSMAKEGKLPGFLTPLAELRQLKEKQTLMNFQFVESPAAQLKDEQPAKKSNLISDKSTVAKDNYEGPSPAVTDTPHVQQTMPGKQVGRLEGAPKVLKAQPAEAGPEERRKREYLEKIKELQQKIEKAQQKINENEAILREQTKAHQEEEEFLKKVMQQKEQEQARRQQPAESRGKVGLGGVDLHNTASNVQGDVDRFGEISFNAERYALGGYFRKLKRKVEEYWLPYLAFTYSGGNMFGNTTVVFFKIMPDGKVKDVQVLKHAGDELLKDFCLSSVQATSPFDPLPEQFLKTSNSSYLPVVFTFNY